MTLNNYFVLLIIIQLIHCERTKCVNLSPYTFWNQTGVTIVGSSNGTKGSSLPYLNQPRGLSMTVDDIMYISDSDNHRIVVIDLKHVNKTFIIGSGPDNNSNQFFYPVYHFIVNSSLYVLDSRNTRVQKQLLNGSNSTTILELNGAVAYYIIVAGNGVPGANDNQLHGPFGIFVDHEKSIYIADRHNHRIMKWCSGNTKSGFRTAGKGTAGSDLTHLNQPIHVFVDTHGYMFITDNTNARILRWAPGSDIGVCIVACTGTSGIASNQLTGPQALVFDSIGSLYVSEWENSRVQKFQILHFHTITYNQAKVGLCATWEDDNLKFNVSIAASSKLVGLMMTTNKTLHDIHLNSGPIFVWTAENITSKRNYSFNLIKHHNLFIGSNGNIYDDNDNFNHRLYLWTLNASNSTEVKDLISKCVYLFIDINDSLYCSIDREHQVMRLFISQNSVKIEVVAGNGKNRSASDSLNNPNGLFVFLDLDLYIADSSNNPIQLVRSGEKNGTTVVGNEMLGIDRLDFPTAVVVDTFGYFYIVDRNNHRIMQSSTNGFRCIIGCSKRPGSAPDQLFYPYALWFDKFDNLFVLDQINHRIRMFYLRKESNTLYHTKYLSCLLSFNCWNSTYYGLNCSHSNKPCNILQPCRNNGTCSTNASNPNGYVCSCSSHFSGDQCEIDLRPCKTNTCWNNGKCIVNETLSKGFSCNCTSHWDGQWCQIKKNYCYEDLCQNRGVCWPLLGNYSCECLSGSYSGRHCEKIATRIIIYEIASKSFGYISILAMLSVALFVVIMDILKYGFGIDPIEREREIMRREKYAKKRKPVIQRFIYVNAPGTSEQVVASSV